MEKGRGLQCTPCRLSPPFFLPPSSFSSSLLYLYMYIFLLFAPLFFPPFCILPFLLSLFLYHLWFNPCPPGRLVVCWSTIKHFGNFDDYPSSATELIILNSYGDPMAFPTVYLRLWYLYRNFDTSYYMLQTEIIIILLSYIWCVAPSKNSINGTRTKR